MISENLNSTSSTGGNASDRDSPIQDQNISEAEQQLQQQKKYTPFQEKHLIENLDVSPVCSDEPIRYYNMLNQSNKRGKETHILALDCERILTKKGDRLARVSIVNYYGNIVFDTLVKPWAKVYDYREWITGIKASDLKHAPSYPKIAPILKKILDGKIVVGHSLKEDFEHLKLTNDEYQCQIRDIAQLQLFKRDNGKEKRKLKELAAEFLNAHIQDGHHSSVIDARIALALYRSQENEFQNEINNEDVMREFVQTVKNSSPIQFKKTDTFLKHQLTQQPAQMVKNNLLRPDLNLLSHQSTTNSSKQQQSSQSENYLSPIPHKSEDSSVLVDFFSQLHMFVSQSEMQQNQQEYPHAQCRKPSYSKQVGYPNDFDSKMVKNPEVETVLKHFVNSSPPTCYNKRQHWGENQQADFYQMLNTGSKKQNSNYNSVNGSSKNKQDRAIQAWKPVPKKYSLDRMI